MDCKERNKSWKKNLHHFSSPIYYPSSFFWSHTFSCSVEKWWIAITRFKVCRAAYQTFRSFQFYSLIQVRVGARINARRTTSRELFRPKRKYQRARLTQTSQGYMYFSSHEILFLSHPFTANSLFCNWKSSTRGKASQLRKPKRSVTFINCRQIKACQC